MNQLKIWMDAASHEEKALLAELAGTSIGNLNQIAGGYRTGGAAAVRAGLARRIEKAAGAVAKRNRALPPLVRTDLSSECRECDFAQRCLGMKSAASGFDILDDTGGG